MEKKTVSLSLGTILRECSKNPSLTQDYLYYFSLKNRENYHATFKYKKFNDDFISRVDCYNDGNYTVGTIRPSYEEFLEKLCRLLNLKTRGKIEDNDSLTEELLKRVERLKEVKTEKELQEQFPLLAKDLRDGRSYFKSLQRLREQEKYKEEEIARGEHYFYSCALKKSLPNFIETQSKLYTRFITRRKELKTRLEHTSFNAFIKEKIDLRKLYLYIMHEYLEKIEDLTDREEIRMYLKMIEKYLSSSMPKDVSITLDSGIVIDITNIKRRFENKKRMLQEDSSVVEWVLIPEGVSQEPIHQSSSPRKLKVDKTLVEKLRKQGERKRVFYETTPYRQKAIGLKKYRGYVAYIYENGEVILDREYSKSAPSTASGNAIYNLKVGDFEELSRCDKQVLRRHPKVGVMNHSSTWEERVEKIITREATEEEKEATKRLIIRLKRKGES